MKKKYISKDLKKSYLIITTVILIVFVQITFFSWNYSKRNGKKEVKLLLNFFKQEISEDDKLDIKTKIEDALEEIPNFENISIVIKNNDFIIKKGDTNLNDIPIKDRVFIYGYYRYYIYNGIIYDGNNKNIQITIIKDLKENIEFVIDISLIFAGVFMLLNLTVFILYKFFYKNMIFQIKKIESEVNKIDIYDETFKLIENKNDYYEENRNIIIATNNILTRLNEQKKIQLNFIQSASHEMKTPLTVMKGYTGMLERWAIEDGDKAVIKEYVGVISNTINETTQLIEKLLFLAENNIKLTKEDFSLKILVDELFKGLLIKYPNSKLEIKGDQYISTDKVLMKLLLFNLIENAVKYGDNKIIKIEINNKFLSILNYGKQIDEESLNKIFDRFYREDKSRNNEIEGHGLGLSIVKIISKQLGYEVEIKNQGKIGVISKIFF